jgi:hypothetical protein
VPEIYLTAPVVECESNEFRSAFAVAHEDVGSRGIAGHSQCRATDKRSADNEQHRKGLGAARAGCIVCDDIFALAVLLMATIGTYGVVSYSVRQRTVEIGTRMALGAVPRDLLHLVVGSGMKMAVWGIAIGSVASIAGTWLLVRNFEIQLGYGGAGAHPESRHSSALCRVGGGGGDGLIVFPSVVGHAALDGRDPRGAGRARSTGLVSSPNIFTD